GDVDWRITLPLLTLACDPSPITVASGSALQVSWDYVEYTHLPGLLVISVDDGDDPDAAAARARLTREGLVPSFEMLLYRFASWPFDPASGFTGDARIVVVHPSSGTFVTSFDDPHLAFSANATMSDLNTTADAVIAHAQESVVAQPAPYPLIEQTRDVVS